MTIDDSWLPTAENINALPEPLRRYIAGLETLCDPAGIVRENTLLKDCNRGLQKMYRNMQTQDEETFKRWRKELRACIVELLYIAHKAKSPTECKAHPRYNDVMRLVDDGPFPVDPYSEVKTYPAYIDGRPDAPFKQKPMYAERTERISMDCDANAYMRARDAELNAHTFDATQAESFRKTIKDFLAYLRSIQKS